MGSGAIWQNEAGLLNTALNRDSLPHTDKTEMVYNTLIHYKVLRVFNKKRKTQLWTQLLQHQEA